MNEKINESHHPILKLKCDEIKDFYQIVLGLGQGEESNNSVENKIINAYLFKEYIESKGFNPENYNQMLELNQDVLGSISTMLRDYRQFLLSTKVKYSELQSAGIYGANGFVEKNGLFVPKSLEADAHFFGGYLPKVPYRRHWYEYPKIGEDFSEYDVTVSNGISKEDQFALILRSDMDLFLGDVLDMSDANYQAKREQLLTRLAQIKNNGSGLNISTDSDKLYAKEYVLLSRKK